MIGRYDRARAAAAVRAQRERTLALLEGLAGSDWERIVTPGWRVREVAAHLISGDEAGLTGRLLRLGVRPVPVEELEAWNEEQVRRWADRPIPALLLGLDRWGRRVARVVAASPGRLRVPGPFGRVSVPWLGMMRVFDEWIHDEDVRRALGRQTDDAPEALGPVVEHLPAAIVVQTLPRIPGAATGAVALCTMGVESRLALDMADRRYGTDMPAAATVTVPAGPGVMMAAGRDAWRDLEAAGTLTIEGDRAAAEVFLDALRAV